MAKSSSSENKALKTFREYQNSYIKSHFRSFSFRLRNENKDDLKIMKFLQDKEQVPDITKYIRGLNQADMKTRKIKVK